MSDSRPAGGAEPTELLRELLDAPPAPAEPWRSPVRLRSASEHRRHALDGFQLRTWLDRWLHHAERLLALAAVVVFGAWLIDGPVRDWLHTARAEQRVVVAEMATAVVRSPESPLAVVPESVPLPFVAPETIDAPEPDVIAPRSAAPPVAVTVQLPTPERLVIPRIGLDTPVQEVFVRDGAWEVAEYAAGYLHGTGLPGDPGNMALAGHAGLRGAVFRDLGQLAPGDELLVEAAGWRYQYRVRESKSVWPTQVEVLAPTASATVTLITCTNWDTQRLVVVGDLVAAHPITGS